MLTQRVRLPPFTTFLPMGTYTDTTEDTQAMSGWTGPASVNVRHSLAHSEFQSPWTIFILLDVHLQLFV
jgi:hypothetical protein